MQTRPNEKNGETLTEDRVVRELCLRMNAKSTCPGMCPNVVLLSQVYILQRLLLWHMIKRKKQ